MKQTVDRRIVAECHTCAIADPNVHPVHQVWEPRKLMTGDAERHRQRGHNVREVPHESM